MNIACALSLQDNENAGKQKERSLAALRPRLAKLGLERVEVQPFGDCQFLAALFSAFVPLDCQELRKPVLKKNPPVSRVSTSTWRAWCAPSLGRRIHALRNEPLIAGQLLRSATKKVSLKGSSLRHLSSHERFGDFRSIVHMLRKHFDAACSIQDSPLKEKIAIKKEKPSSWPKGLTACIRAAANWLETRNMWKNVRHTPHGHRPTEVELLV